MVAPNLEPNERGILPLQTMYSSIGFDSYAWGFLAEADEIEISLHDPGVAEDPACGPIVDTVAINIVAHEQCYTRLSLALGRTNLVKNGNFEEGPYACRNSSWGVLTPPNIEDVHSPLPAWMIESLRAVKYVDAAQFAVPKGKQAVELVAVKESAIAQTIRTTPGKVYVLTFALWAFAGKDTIKASYESKAKGGLIHAKLPFKAVAPQLRITFLSTFYTTKVDGSLCDSMIDDVKVLGARFPCHHQLVSIAQDTKAEMVISSTVRNAAVGYHEISTKRRYERMDSDYSSLLSRATREKGMPEVHDDDMQVIKCDVGFMKKAAQLTVVLLGFMTSRKYIGYKVSSRILWNTVIYHSLNREKKQIKENTRNLLRRKTKVSRHKAFGFVGMSCTC
ncbi:hypothetical protein Ancab_029404 [Ancistrocladus abbreviatus]